MATQDKVLLMHKVEGTLKPRMFANMLEEAVDEIQEHLDEFDVRHICQEGTLETDDMLNSYLEAKKVGGLAESTLVAYQYTIERFMKSVNVRTRDINKEHVLNYFKQEEERGVSDGTLEGVRQRLNAYFGWLEREKMIHRNPLSGIAAIKCQIKVKEAFSGSDTEMLKRYCHNIRDIAIINILMASGCRISEIVGMNRDNIDLNSGECIVLGKGNKERTVYFNDIAVKTLKEYLATRNDDCEALFIGKNKKRLQPGGIRAMLKKLANESGIEKVHPHRFRRTTITTLLNRGMPIQEVAILAGHSKIDTTMKYFHASKERIKSSYQRYIQ